MDLQFIDILIVVSYVLILFGLGFSFAKQKTSDENYMLSARKLSLPAFVMTIVTTWYGLILGVGEFVFGYGVVGWVINGLVWYLVYLFFAFVLAKKIHDSNRNTVADQLRARAGKISGMIGAIMTYVMTTPAPYVFSLGILLNVLFGISLFWSIIIGFFISGIYIWWGGFRAVVKTDMFQFVFMYLGFGILLILSIVNFGGLSFLTNNLPETHLTWQGTLGIGPIIVWGLLAFWTLVDPNFYQRCFAAKDGNTAKKGILWATVFWFIFDMLTLFTGLYARAAFPESDPLFSYLTLADAVLPVVIKGLFVVTLLAIIMSTIDSFLFASSSIVANDFVQKEKRDEGSLTKFSRAGILITLVTSLLFVWVFQSIIGIIYGVGTVGVSALLFPIIISFVTSKQLSDKLIASSMIIAIIVSGVWLITGWIRAEYGWPVYPGGIEPMYLGLGASALVLTLGYKKLFKS